MTDFMKWLYPRYIKPYMDSIKKDEYEMWFTMMAADLEPRYQEEFEKTLEFTAVHAFLLGLRTGQGLAPHISAGLSETGPSVTLR